MISTPKQLITVVVLAFAVPLTIILLIVQFITGGIKVDPNSSAMSEQAIAKRMNPLSANKSNQMAGSSSSESVAVALDPGESLSTIPCVKRATPQALQVRLKQEIKPLGLSA